MTDNKYAATTWGKPQYEDLEVPSGQLCQVRLPGVQQMIAAGVIDSADTLTTLVDQKHIKRVQGRAAGKAPEKQIDPQSLMRDPENLKKLFAVIDRVCIHMVVQPTVVSCLRDVDGEQEVIPLEDRTDGVIYSDQIDMLDKMFIFQYAVGGGTDLDSFRKQFGEAVGSLAIK
ncbi:MAG: hypothetical protein AB7L09_22245 [Nitrospira sp.]